VPVDAGDHDEAVGIGIREGAEEDRVDNAVNCGVGTNAEAKRGEDRNGERRTLGELAGGVSKIVPECQNITVPVCPDFSRESF
jgi:hypothetical protein